MRTATQTYQAFVLSVAIVTAGLCVATGMYAQLSWLVPFILCSGYMYCRKL